MTIRPAEESDLPGLLAVYNYAVRELDALWTEREETLEERAAWLRARTGAGYPVLAALDDAGKMVGYGTFGEFKAKEGYRLTVEHSVYLLPEAQGRGLGTALMHELIALAKSQGRHAMVAVIEDRNTVSIRLHEKFGFEKAGHLPETGIKHGRWLGQVTMLLLLDDRKVPPGPAFPGE